MTGQRFFDLCGGLLLLLVTLPVQIAIAIGVLATMGRPIFFLQPRAGQHGRCFRIIKFRSMREERRGEDVHSTARLTPFGHWLRKNSLDELPELLNVIKGDMSLIGPRPLLPEYLSLYNAEQAKRHRVKPGLTGLAQVKGRNGVSWTRRLKYDAWYAEHRSFCLDVKILLMTVPLFLNRSGVDQDESVTMEPFRGNHR